MKLLHLATLLALGAQHSHSLPQGVQHDRALSKFPLSEPWGVVPSDIAENDALVTAFKKTEEQHEGQNFKELGSQRGVFTFGPYSVAPATLLPIEGMHAPCGDCIVTYFRPNLVYEDGSDANVDSDMLLQYVIVVNPTRPDTSCPDQKRQRVFAGGNERVGIDFSKAGALKVGYELNSENFFFTIGVLNMAQSVSGEDKTKKVMITIEWEWIPKDTALSQFEVITPLWLDVAEPCNTNHSLLPVPPGMPPSFTVSQPSPWVFPEPSSEADSGDGGKAPKLGRNMTVWATGGHLTDGGVHLVHRRSGEPVCTAIASYATKPGFVDGSGRQRVSDMGHCHDMGVTVPGDEWTVDAAYDFDRFKPDTDAEGHPQPLQGVGLVYLGQKPGAV